MIEGVISTLIAAALVWLFLQGIYLVKFDKGNFLMKSLPGVDSTRWQLYKTYSLPKRLGKFIAWRWQGRL